MTDAASINSGAGRTPGVALELLGGPMHIRLNAALGKAPTLDEVSRKYAHLREQKRRADVEARGRADVTDLYEDL